MSTATTRNFSNTPGGSLSPEPSRSGAQAAESSAPSAICIEHVSKRYMIQHQHERHNFATLRDSIVSVASGFGRKLARPFGGGGPPSRSREEFWALKDINFDIKRGERVGVIGRNGAGKSTLLKVLSRITHPTAGRVTMQGRVASLLEVGTGFHPDLTGRENIYLNGAILGMTRTEIRRNFDEIVTFAEVERFLDTPVKRYSSGMYVRLAFSVAAHLEPEILIVDEVLAVGDIEFQKKCLGKMQDVSATDGRTVLFVSHNMAAVRTLCTRAMFLKNGQMLKSGQVQDVVDFYIHQGGSGAVADAHADSEHFELVSLDARTPTDSPPCTFQPAIIDVTYRPHHDIVDAGANIMLEDLNGSPILGLDSRDFVSRIPARKDQVVLCRFNIASLPLTPGPYRLRVWVKSDRDNIFWEVPEAYDVTIEGSAIYGSRQVERRWHGVAAAVANAEVGVS